MRILDLLAPERVVADIAARDKEQLLARIAELLDPGAASRESLLASLRQREKLGSTGLGYGIAIPHGRSAALEGAVAAFVRLAEPLDFESLDGQPVDLVFALVVPEHFTHQHLMFLAELAELFSDTALVQELRTAPDSEALYQALAAAAAQNAPA